MLTKIRNFVALGLVVVAVAVLVPKLTGPGSDRDSPEVAVLHVEWDGYREFHIKWHNSQGGSGDFYQKPHKIGNKWGGWWEITTPTDQSKKLALSVSAGPRLGPVEWKGRAYCSIRHLGDVVDDDERQEGNVICIASNMG